jgi:hypothetical protein
MSAEVDIDGLRKNIGTKIVEEDEASSLHSIETRPYPRKAKRFRPDGIWSIFIHLAAKRH